MKIRATQQCTRTGCHRFYEVSFDTDDVSARITNGGGVEICWPVPDLPPDWEHDFGSIYCPDHARRIPK